MSDPQSYRPKTSDIPHEPGVYRFLDEYGRVIYVGKAKNLRSRLTSYFAAPETLPIKTRQMVTAASSVQWTVMATEVEALQLEYTWIKELDPKYNVIFRDDKTYPYIAITMKDMYPAVVITRKKNIKGARYFGPYPKVGPVRAMLDTMLSVFPLRTCSSGIYRRAERSGQPCLLGYIDKCSAPCVGRISKGDYDQIVNSFSRFLAGDGKDYIKEYKRLMSEAAAEQKYEEAARYRDRVEDFTKVFERNTIVLSDNSNLDIYGIEEDDLEASIYVFYVRNGQIRGQQSWIVEKVEDISTGELIAQLIQQKYGQESEPSLNVGLSEDYEMSVLPEKNLSKPSYADRKNAQEIVQFDDREYNIPHTILVPTEIAHHDHLEQWLTQLRGSQVTVKMAQRGEKAQLARTVHENAKEAFRQHKIKRVGDITARSQALQDIQDALDLEMAPLRIESFDISHISGTNVVASMVVVEDGLPKNNLYRKFAITGDAARDDTASMYDVITRRFKRLILEEEQARQHVDSHPHDNLGTQIRSGEISREDATSKKLSSMKRFSYRPQLVVVDGGQPQVAAAQQALKDLGIDDIPVVGLAKRLEEIWLPDDDFPVILSRTSNGLYLLQRIRDEAHRFAISFHREKRTKKMVASSLENIEGLGSAKAKVLLKYFGSVKKIRQANIDQLQEVSGIGPLMAQKIYDKLHEETPMPAVDMATGEIVD